MAESCGNTIDALAFKPFVAVMPVAFNGPPPVVSINVGLFPVDCSSVDSRAMDTGLMFFSPCQL